MGAGEAIWRQEFLGADPVRLGKLLGLTGKEDPFSEWYAYQKLLRSIRDFHGELFLGLLDNRPRLVPKNLLEGHAYILGGTGTGKTSTAVAQLLMQLADGAGPPPPIFIFDLKPEGDRYLRGVAEWLSRRRTDAGEQGSLAFFSNRAGYQSLEFDPLHALLSQPSDKARAQSIIQSLMPTRTDKADEVFFLNENRQLLERVIQGSEQPKPKTFQDIIHKVDLLSRGKGGNREARGVHGALSDFVNMPHVRIGPPPQDTSGDLDFGRVLSTRQIAYVHLDSQSLPLASRSLGRLMLSCLFAEAVDRKIKHNNSPEFYLFIDEFHEIASTNVANFLTTARSAGARCILSHQSTASLDNKVTEVLLQNTSLQMLLSPDDAAVVDAFIRAAGEKIDIQRGGSTGVSYKRGATSSEMAGASSNSRDSTTSQSSTDGHSRGMDESFGNTWSERRVSSLTPEMLADLDSMPQTAMVRVKKKGDSSTAKTPWRGIAVLDLLYPFTTEEKDQFEAVSWPAEAVRPPESIQPENKGKGAKAVAKPALAPDVAATRAAVEARVTARHNVRKPPKPSKS
jgi:hypothetical protein